jgi:ATP-dependent DNA ligase
VGFWDARLPIERRKARLARMLRGPLPGMVINEHFVGHGDIVFAQACQLGREGMKRLGSLYRSGRSKHWLEVKNPAAPAVRREPRRSGVEAQCCAYLNVRLGSP